MPRTLGLETDIAEWFERVRRARCEAALAAGVPTSVLVELLHGYSDGPDRITYRRQELKMSVDAHASLARTIDELLPYEPDDLCTALKFRLVEERAEQLDFWQMSAPPTQSARTVSSRSPIERSRWGRAVQLLHAAAQAYTRDLTSLRHGRPRAAEHLAREALDFLADDCWTVTTFVPLVGVTNVKRPRAAPGVTLRPLTAREVGAQTQGSGGSHIDDGTGHLRPLPRMPFAFHALEICARVPKSQPPQDHHRWRKVLLALQLLGVPLAPIPFS